MLRPPLRGAEQARGRDGGGIRRTGGDAHGARRRLSDQ